jgi:hypothetical protein
VLRESILNRDKDPDGVFGRKVADVNTSSHPYFRPMEIPDVDALADINEARKTAEVFDAAFGPGVGGWTLVMVGNLVVEDVIPQLLEYFGAEEEDDGTTAMAEADAEGADTAADQSADDAADGAQAGAEAEAEAGAGGDAAAAAAARLLTTDRTGIKSLNVQFPSGSHHIKVERKMQGCGANKTSGSFVLVFERSNERRQRQAQDNKQKEDCRQKVCLRVPFFFRREPRARACITFSAVPIERASGRLDALRLLTHMDLAVAVLEKCLRETLRFDKGGVYGVSCRSSYGTSPPLPNEPLNGTLGIDFDCAPERQEELIKAALDEVEKRKVECCAEEKVSSMVEVLRRDHEESLRTNGAGETP